MQYLYFYRQQKVTNWALIWFMEKSSSRNYFLSDSCWKMHQVIRLLCQSHALRNVFANRANSTVGDLDLRSINECSKDWFYKFPHQDRMMITIQIKGNIILLVWQNFIAWKIETKMLHSVTVNNKFVILNMKKDNIFTNKK